MNKDSMRKTNNIIIKKKPDDVSWDEIHNVLYESHGVNRSNGIFQATAELSGAKLEDMIADGQCFVAMDDNKIVGTCSVRIKHINRWFAKGKAAYYMLDGVIPAYQGMGIFTLLDNARDRYVEENNISVIYTNTPEKNKRLQKQKLSKGYHLAGFFAPSKVNYYSVVLVKWRDNSPKLWYIKMRFYYSKLRTLIKHRGRLR